MEEGLIKSSSEYISLGVGVRVIKDNNYGYAHTSDLTFEKIRDAALSAAAIATGNSKVKNVNVNETKIKHQYYDLSSPVVDVALKEKINLIQKTHDAALNFDAKVKKVNVSLSDEMQYITIANSEGLLISDVRPQTRLVVSATAIDGNNRGTGRANIGGRVGYTFYTNKNDVAQKILNDSVLRQYPIHGVSGANDTDILLYTGQDTNIQRVWYVTSLTLCIMATKDKKQVLSHCMSHTSD
jgi:TldD protein